MSLFNYENKVWDTISKIGDVVCLSLLWLVSGLPLLTIGCSTAAFYHCVSLQLQDCDGPVWRSYWHYFRLHFKKATAIWLLHFAGLFLFYLEFYAVNMAMQDSLLGFIFMGLLMFLFLLFFGCTIYVYPLLACWNAPVGKLLFNSLLLAVEHLPTTLLLTALLIFTVIGCFFAMPMFPILIGIYIVISSFLVIRVLRKHNLTEENLEFSN